jgi:hypothetical protein
LIFLNKEAREGGLTARALGVSIFTQADDLNAMRERIRDAVLCHYPSEEARPKIVRLHYVRDEVMAL